MSSTIITTEEEAQRLRLVLERGIQAVATPDVAEKACRNQRKLMRELETIAAENPAVPLEDEAPTTVNFSMQRPPQSEDANK